MVCWIIGGVFEFCLILYFIDEATGGKYRAHASSESDDHMAALMMYSAMHDNPPGPPDYGE